MRRSLTRVGEEDGAALMLVALALTGFVLFLAFVLDAANWFMHKRHLQLQADAAALAGGSAFRLPCDNGLIYSTVRTYAGVKDGTYTDPYNRQVGGTPDNKVHIRVNSTQYQNEGGIDFSDGGQPCEAGMIDVKMTERDLPWFLSSRFVPAINAHARVAFNQVDTVKGHLPIGVPDVNPHSGAVIFYNESNGEVIAAKYLTKVGGSGGLTTWGNTDDPALVSMPDSGHMGAVIALSTKGPPPAGATPMSISGSLVTDICNQSRVDCYDATGTTVNGGLLYIHGWEPTTSPSSTPKAEAATLMNSTAACSDFPYGYYFYGVTQNCTVTLTLEYSWIPGTGQSANDLQLKARGGTCGNNGCSRTNSGPVAATFDIPIAAGSGRNPIIVDWAVRNGTVGGVTCGNNFNNTNCQGSFGVVQRAFAGDDDVSGPIRVARLWNMGDPFTAGLLNCPTYPAFGTACHNLRKGPGREYRLAVTVRIAGALATSVTDPPVALRVVGRSQNGSIDCNATGNLRDQIANGCNVFYKTNTDPTGACPYSPQNKAGMFSTPQPYVCVATQTGGSVGQFTQGIQDRILGSSSPVCPSTYNGQNHWADFGTDLTFPHLDDPRLIMVFLVPFGSFRSSGNDLFPVTGVGEFYITGWGGNGGGNDDPCAGADPAPAGYLMGHFLNRPIDSSQGTGTGACDPTSLIPCVAVLTK